jgi:vacuole morphology and inheritance protein 14
LADESTDVVRKSLLLLAQISDHSKEEYFKNFMRSLVGLFSDDRLLLESRGSIIVRELCLSMNAERVLLTLAGIVEEGQDLDFASRLIQNLTVILVTTEELASIRQKLRNTDRKENQQLFSALYRAWCHNAIATFTLCLLAQSYDIALSIIHILSVKW